MDENKAVEFQNAVKFIKEFDGRTANALLKLSNILYQLAISYRNLLTISIYPEENNTRNADSTKMEIEDPYGNGITPVINKEEAIKAFVEQSNSLASIIGGAEFEWLTVQKSALKPHRIVQFVNNRRNNPDIRVSNFENGYQKIMELKTTSSSIPGKIKDRIKHQLTRAILQLCKREVVQVNGKTFTAKVKAMIKISFNEGQDKELFSHNIPYNNLPNPQHFYECFSEMIISSWSHNDIAAESIKKLLNPYNYKWKYGQIPELVFHGRPNGGYSITDLEQNAMFQIDFEFEPPILIDLGDCGLFKENQYRCKKLKFFLFFERHENAVFVKIHDQMALNFHQMESTVWENENANLTRSVNISEKKPKNRGN